MLPCDWLKGAKERKIWVQIKNGDNINGVLEQVDVYMNLKIKDAVYTNSNGSKFYKSNEIFIRGNNISGINFEDKLLSDIENAKRTEENKADFLSKKRDDRGNSSNNNNNIRGGSNHRGGRGNTTTPNRGRYAPNRRGK